MNKRDNSVPIKCDVQYYDILMMEIFVFFSLLSFLCMHVVHSQNQNQIHGTHTHIYTPAPVSAHPTLGRPHLLDISARTHRCIYVCMHRLYIYICIPIGDTLKIIWCNPENIENEWEIERKKMTVYMEIWNGCNFPFASMLHDFRNASVA